jgi:mono/diheme cytochrome c family protein
MKTTLTLAMLALAVTGNVAHAQAVDGKTLFAKNCAACHQATGLGIPGAFPALKGNVFAQGDPAIVTATVLKGRAGMPAFAASLDDENLAAVLTYVRSAWGNKAAAVSTADVAAVRSTASIAPVMHDNKGTIIH